MITIYSAENCNKCTMTKSQLDKLGLEYNEVRIDLDDDARAYCMSLGYLTVPVVVTETEHWSDFRIDRIKALAKRLTESGNTLKAS